MKSLSTLVVFFILFFASSCIPASTQVAPMPTEKKNKPAVTVTAIAPTVTKTPDVTVTPEIKQYPVCPDITKYKDYPIPAWDLVDGTYLKYLDSISQPFDQTKIQTNILLRNYQSEYGIEYDTTDAPHFIGKNSGTEPFRRNRTCGFTTYQGHDYVVMPIEYFNPKCPTKNSWVITVLPLTGDNGPLIFGSQAHPTTDPTDTLLYWRDQINVPIMLDVSFNAGISNGTDPLVQSSWYKYPDIQNRIARFVTKVGSVDPSLQDVTALSGPIMLARIQTTTSNWYK